MSAPVIAAALIGILVATIATMGLGLAIYDYVRRRAQAPSPPQADFPVGSSLPPARTARAPGTAVPGREDPIKSSAGGSG